MALHPGDRATLGQINEAKNLIAKIARTAIAITWMIIVTFGGNITRLVKMYQIAPTMIAMTSNWTIPLIGNAP
jgi:hypothetical protein